jgi:hypothetical protein
MDKGILSIIDGGLGNILFQVIAAYVASKKYNCKLYLIKSLKKNHHQKFVDYSENILKYVGIFIKDYDTFVNNSFAPGEPHNFFDNSTYQFYISTEAYSNDNLKLPIIFNQYFQYYPPLKNYEKEIREVFLKGLHEYRENITKSYDTSDSIFLHIRRGDYLNLQYRHPVQPLSYYEKCLNIIDDSDVKNIYVFSDGLGWAKEQSLFTDNKKIIFIDTDDEVYTLAFMSLCTKGAICANSTFSWWGAYLGAYSLRSKVFVPKLWMINGKIDSLFPDEWIIIE